MTGELSLFKPKANVCKPCDSAYHAEWKRKNPEKAAAYAATIRSSGNLRRYELRRRAVRCGQDPDFIEEYHRSHDGCCEICGRRPGEGERDLHIDHDHSTGKFRGLICNNCNGGLGRFKDSPEAMEAAIRYLRRTLVP